MSNIALYEKIDSPGLMANLEKLGENFAASGLLGVKNKAQGVVMALTCAAENMTPVEFNNTFHVVTYGGQTQLSMRADAMQAKFQESGGRIEWIQTNSDVCEAKFIHKDYAPNGITLKTTLQELAKSGVASDDDGKTLKFMYKKFPRQMLRARIISEGVRMINPSIVAGYYTPEEVSDFDDKPQRRSDKPLLPKSRPDDARETEAKIVNEESATNTDSLLEANESAVNAYLIEILHWIDQGATWRDLQPGHRETIDARIDGFIGKAVEYFTGKGKDPANV